MFNRFLGFSDRRGDGWRFPSFIEYLRTTQSFNHLSDDVIRGWILGRLELFLHYRSHTRTRTRIKSVPCSKCSGRGWFGRGRPPCPECIAIGIEPTTERRVWIEPPRYTVKKKRALHASMYQMELIESHSSWFERYDDAVRNRKTVYPEWVDDLCLCGDYSKKQKRTYLKKIRHAMSWTESDPKLKGGEFLWESDVNYYYIDLQTSLIRLALTFGCTCPITGDYVRPDAVSFLSDVYPWRPVTDHVKPLGFCVSRKFVSPFSRCFIVVSPFSLRGLKIIKRAASKCQKELSGELNSEWILAEVMQSALLKRAA